MEGDLLPWALAGTPLGEDVLEIGPGPGAVTDLLLPQVRHLTCVENDRRQAEALAQRLAGSNVSVHCEDAATLPFPTETFDTVLCLMVLHHVAPVSRQDRVLSEAARVLRPDGTFILMETHPSLLMKALHIGDTLLPTSPDTIGARLASAGFGQVHLDVRPHGFRARAARALDTARAGRPTHRH
jgi:SAM-dependent methyltransferase